MPTNQIETFNKYYNSLNPEQKEAVDHIEGPVMVIAGAGTGKTQILAVRIAKILLETQIDPFNILCLTFTEAGVTAMRNRLIEIIGTTAYHIKICTFHGFCNEIIRENSEVFMFKQNSEQLDDLSRIEYLEKAIDSLNIGSPLKPSFDKDFFLKDIDSQIRNLKKENIDPETLSERLNELEELLTELNIHLSELIEAKRTFPAEICSLANPKTLFPCLNLKEPISPFKQHYLDYLESLYENYTGSLCGEKRKDNSAGKKLRDAVQKLVKGGLEDIPKQKDLMQIYKSFNAILQEKKSYDYEDMIMQTVKKLKENPSLLGKYQEIYQYILVDEYQDTNSSQNHAVSLLGQFFDNPNIFVVGDDDQSIYRFQGASIENIINFHKQYSNHELKVVTLTQNYRSQQTILDAACTMIEKNKTRIASYLKKNNIIIDKHLKSFTNIEPKPINLYIYSKEQSEIYGTAKKIEELIQSGTEPSEIAVLYHKHAEATELTELLKKLKIPFELKAGENILQNIEISKLLTLFRLIENPNNDEIFCQTLFLDFLNFNKLDILKFANHFNLKRLGYQHSWFTAVNSGIILEDAKISNPQKFREFASSLANWRELSGNITMPEFFITVLNESGFLKHQVNDKRIQIEILNKINTLYKEIKTQTHKDHELTITEFLEQLKTRQKHDLKLIEEPLQINTNAVQLITVHGSKGLEFEEVFIIRATSRSWDKAGRINKVRLPAGLVKSLISDEKLEMEEDNRRLFYVAMTRAKKQLHISYAKQRFENGGKGKEDIPTIYLNEIPKEHIKEISTTEIEANLPNYLETLFKGGDDTDSISQEIKHFKALTNIVKISPTGLNTFNTCPRRFFYNNLLRLPQAKAAYLSMGTAIHKAFELFINKYRKTKINPGLDSLLLHYKEALKKEMLTQKDYKDRLEYGNKLITDYFNTKGNTITSNEYSEENFSSHNVHLDEVPITGKIDKISIKINPTTNSEELIVTDFKTGNPDNQSAKTAENGDYWRQMIFYKILADNSPKFKRKFQNRPIRTSQLEFLEKSRKTKEYITKSINVTDKDIQKVTENIKYTYKQILDMQFDKIEYSEPCEKCPFARICWNK